MFATVGSITSVLPMRHFHSSVLIFLFIALFKLAPSRLMRACSSLFIILFFNLLVNFSPHHVLVFSKLWRSSTGRSNQKNTPVSRKLTATSKHSRGKETRGGRPMRHRPSSELSSTTGDM
jgi:hypothetical protein